MNARTAAVVVVLVVAAFVVAVTVGATADRGTSDDRNGLVDRIEDLAGGAADLPREAVAAGCPDEDDPDLLRVPGGLAGGCTLVAESDDRLRLVRLEAVTAFSVRAPAPEGDLDADVSDDVAAGEEAAIAVGEGTTEIRLDCPGAECLVRLVGG